MIGRNHVIAGTCSALCVGMGVDTLSRATGGVVGEYLQPVAAQVKAAFTTMGDLPMWVVLGIGVTLFVFGTLLPDIDSEHSLLGRHMHLPVEHRTWTHAIWFVLLSGMASLAVPVLWWFTAGYFTHLFWDSLSRGGVCWFYPFSRYLKFSGGAKVKRGHTLKLYGVGDGSETVVVIAVAVFTLLIGYAYGRAVLGWPLPDPLIL